MLLRIGAGLGFALLQIEHAQRDPGQGAHHNQCPGGEPQPQSTMRLHMNSTLVRLRIERKERKDAENAKSRFIILSLCELCVFAHFALKSESPSASIHDV